MYISSLALINPRLCQQLGLRVELEQGGECPIPHLHVHDKSDEENVAYIRLDRPEYSEHHNKNSNKLTKTQKQQFIDVMNKATNKYITSIHDDELFKRATGYQYAVDTWIDTYGGEEKFKFDKEGFPIMPDYEQL